MTETFLTIAGRRVRVLSGGEGRPVVLVHAFPLSAEQWRPQLDAPPSGWQVVAPDLRGFGWSDRHGTAADSTARGAQSMADYARDVVGVADALGFRSFVLGGLSMGGYVTFEAFRQAPHRIRALVLADTRADTDSGQAREGRHALRRLLREQGMRAVADTMLPRLLGATTHRSNQSLVAAVRRMVESTAAGAVDDGIECLLGRPDSTPDLARIACPTLVLCGDEDGVTSVDIHEGLQKAIASSALVVVHGAGHLSNLERPDIFNLTLRAFLSSLGQGH